PGQRLHGFLQVGVGAGLVVGEVVVPPAGHLGQPLDQVGRKVDGLQFDVLADVVGGELVHGLHVGQHSVLLGPALGGPGPAGVDAVGARHVILGGNGGDGLPPGQGPQAGIGADQVQQVGGAGAGQARHQDGPVDLHIEDLRVALDEILEAQPGGGVAGVHLQHVEAGDVGGPAVLVEGVHPHIEALAKIVGTKITEPRLRHGGGENALGGDLHGVGFHGGENLLLDGRQYRVVQVGDVDDLAIAHG